MKTFRSVALAALVSIAVSGATAADFISKVGDAMPNGLVTQVQAVAPSFVGTGKVTAVAFVDCSSKRCEELLPLLESSLWKPLQGQDFQLVAVAVRADKPSIEALTTTTGVSFPVLADPEGELFGLFANNGVPRMLMFDAKGRLAYQHGGFRAGREAEFRKVADLLLAGEPVPPRISNKAAAKAPAPDNERYAKDIMGQQAPDVPVEEWITTPPPSTEGKYVLVDFWATWCGPCVASLDMAEPLHGQFEDRLVSMAVSDEPAAKVAAMVKRKGWKQHIGIDTQARTKSALEIRAIPHAFLADPSGKVIWQGHPGSLWTNDAELLKQLLKPATP